MTGLEHSDKICSKYEDFDFWQRLYDFTQIFLDIFLLT